MVPHNEFTTAIFYINVKHWVLLDESWWHVPFHDLVLCGLYGLLPHLENTATYIFKKRKKEIFWLLPLIWMALLTILCYHLYKEKKNSFVAFMMVITVYFDCLFYATLPPKKNSGVLGEFHPMPMLGICSWHAHGANECRFSNYEQPQRVLVRFARQWRANNSRYNAVTRKTRQDKAGSSHVSSKISVQIKVGP